MATYDFSTLIASGNASQAFLPTDVLTFNDTISASDLIVATSVSNTTIRLSTGFILTLTGFSLKQIDSTKFVFADGSKMIVGDGLAATVNDDGVNKLVGTEFNDYLDGLLGIDTISYETATSAVTVDLSNVAAQNTVGAGIDKLANIENITGSLFNDTLTGDANANTLDGGGGFDTMDGKDGSDTYIVTAGDLVTDTGATGTDTVNSGVDYGLGSGIENLVLTGTTAINGRGNSLNNTITGNSGNNTLDGGTGDDILVGGLGADTYFVDSANDSITETTTGGTDSVISSASAFDMNLKAANVENLRLVGSAISGTGNALINSIFGNSNSNILDGGAGNDTLTDLSGGNDTLIGGTGVDALKAGKGDDILKANGGSEETASTVFSGSASSGATIILGGLTLTTTATMTAAQIVAAFISQNAAGKGSFTGTLTGWTLQQGGTTATLVATSTVLGDVTNFAETGTHAGLTVGAPTIVAGTSGIADVSIDTLTGGVGNDTYYVDGTNDVVNEAANPTAGGTTWINANNQDEVKTTVTYSLNDTSSVGVDNLTIVAGGSINATGNSINNIIKGNSGDNILIGGKGADSLVGGTGNDTLTGGLDALAADSVADTLSGGTGNDTYNVTDAIDIINEVASAGTDTVNTTVTFALNDNASIGVENLTLKGSANINGTGNSLGNTITGNIGNNQLFGLAGNDTLNDLAGGNDLLDGGTGADAMSGGLGDDTYIVDNSSDTVIEAALNGTDLVKAGVTYTLTDADIEKLSLTGSNGLSTATDAIDGTGNASANTITGNNGNNTLIGGDNADLLIGGAGNDLLVGGTLDVGTIIGGITADADSMAGGLGDDTYSVDFITDVVTEATGEGTDLVKSRVTYTISANVENLTLTGSTGASTNTDVIDGTGNSLANELKGNAGKNSLFGMAGIDTLNGNGGADTLDGGTGADTMSGGAGNDTYIVDTTNTSSSDGDIVTETATVGEIDLVRASVTYTIFDTNVENLTLTGSNNINGTGNSSANILTGNAGVNTLKGLAGNDTLDGGTGIDRLIGGNGNDIYFVDDTTEVVDETTDTSGADLNVATIANASLDTVNSTATYTISDTKVENLTLLGTIAIDGTGNSSANILTGNAANNVLSGLNGDDIINGGAGKDTMSGGSGVDQFIFSAVTDSGLVNFDIISDFKVSGADKINLSAIDVGILAFGGLKSGTPTVVSGTHKMEYYVSGSNTIVIADTDGNASTIDFKVQLTGVTSSIAATFTSNDFVL